MIKKNKNENISENKVSNKVKNDKKDLKIENKVKITFINDINTSIDKITNFISELKNKSSVEAEKNCIKKTVYQEIEIFVNPIINDISNNEQCDKKFEKITKVETNIVEKNNLNYERMLSFWEEIIELILKMIEKNILNDIFEIIKNSTSNSDTINKIIISANLEIDDLKKIIIKYNKNPTKNNSNTTAMNNNSVNDNFNNFIEENKSYNNEQFVDNRSFNEIKYKNRSIDKIKPIDKNNITFKNNKQSKINENFNLDEIQNYQSDNKNKLEKLKIRQNENIRYFFKILYDKIVNKVSIKDMKEESKILTNLLNIYTLFMFSIVTKCSNDEKITKINNISETLKESENINFETKYEYFNSKLNILILFFDNINLINKIDNILLETETEKKLKTNFIIHKIWKEIKNIICIIKNLSVKQKYDLFKNFNKIIKIREFYKKFMNNISSFDH